MANPEHLEILEQGVKVWNEWRKEHPDARPNLRYANLNRANLSHADLSHASLIGANLKGADLSQANLNNADLKEAFLIDAILVKANLSHAVLVDASLGYANLNDAILNDAILNDAGLINAFLINASLINASLKDANLEGTNLTNANLKGANLCNADLLYTNLNKVNLSGADFTNCALGFTMLGDIDLSKTKGLESVSNILPSTIGIDTIYKSRGEIPEVFLRGCGVPDEFITYMRSLVANPIQFYSCFISYSSKNQDFAERLYSDLQNKGVRCWYAPEDMKIGDKIRDRIDESIRLRDKLLLILSENSIASDWVENEVESALEEERHRGRAILFPVRIDDAVMESKKAWAASIRRTRHIGDFTYWKEHDSYQKAFERLLRDLKAEKKE